MLIVRSAFLYRVPWRLVVKRLQFSDYFLRVSCVDLQKSSAATPVAGQNHHLHVCRLARHCFDYSRRFVLGAGLKLVFTRFRMYGKPAAIRQAVHLFAVQVYGWLQGGSGEVTLTEENDG